MTKAPQHDELVKELERLIVNQQHLNEGERRQRKRGIYLSLAQAEGILTALCHPPAQNSGDAGDDTPDALAREPLPCHLCGEPMVRDDQQWRHGPQQEGCFLALQYLDDDDDIAHWNAVREPLRPSPTRDAVADGEGVAIDRLAHELRERSRFPSGVARISAVLACEIAEAALRTANTGRDEVLPTSTAAKDALERAIKAAGRHDAWPSSPAAKDAEAVVAAIRALSSPPVTTVADEPYHMDAEEHTIMHEALSKSVDIRPRPLADVRGRAPSTTDEGETR